MDGLTETDCEGPPESGGALLRVLLAAGSGGRLLHTQVIPRRGASFAWDVPVGSEPTTWSSSSWPSGGELAASAGTMPLPSGVTRIYSHQAEAVGRALGGRHIVLATSTASGKTLALALPGLLVQTASDPDSTVLALAPTRALVEQWRERLCALPGIDPTSVCTYTGDTPKGARAALRERAHWLVTTPDMLHVGLLPYHMRWHRFLAHLRFVLVDESHVYRGVFGAHVGHVLRRLRRMAAAHGASAITALFASATIGNPAEHASALLGMPVEMISEDGAPSPGRVVALWRPPDWRGHSEESAALCARFVEAGARTILFGQARQSVERMLREVQARLPAHLRGRVAAYRAGYLAEERRALEHRLASGELLGVVTTNALELGIDIGGLDVSILDGFPGSVASFWQQAGRAGRGARAGLTVLVLREDALDQFFAAHPERLLATPAERALINVSNPTILPAHLHCAAAERPLTLVDLTLFGEAAADAADHLVHEGRLMKLNGTYRLRAAGPGADNPALHVSLREASDRVVLLERVDFGGGGVGGAAAEHHAAEGIIEESDAYHAITECYPGAIYLSQGVAFEVRELDLERRHVLMGRGAATEYYTEPLSQLEVAIVDEHARTLLDAASQAELLWGMVRVTTHVTGYARIRQRSRELLGLERLATPLSWQLETQAFWLTLGPAVVRELVDAGRDVAGSLHAAEHGMIALLPLFVLGDRRDLGGVSVVPQHPQTGEPTIFVYDAYPGGTGYAAEAYARFRELAAATHEAILRCACESGCYACVQSPKCGNQNRPLDKAGAAQLLAHLLEQMPRAPVSAPTANDHMSSSAPRQGLP